MNNLYITILQLLIFKQLVKVCCLKILLYTESNIINYL